MNPKDLDPSGTTGRILLRAARSGSVRVYMRTHDLWYVLESWNIPKRFEPGKGDRESITLLADSGLIRSKVEKAAEAQRSTRLVIDYELTAAGREMAERLRKSP
jgi:hypothetical protein